jgi:hypothetical protein
MSRFQALTNSLLDDELEMLRDRLGLARGQKADLLREVTALAAWVVRQAELGRDVEARRGETVEALVHPALERLRRAPRSVGHAVTLSEGEVERLTAALARGFDPPAPLRAALASLAATERRPPKLRWKKSVA